MSLPVNNSSGSVSIPIDASSSTRGRKRGRVENPIDAQVQEVATEAIEGNKKKRKLSGSEEPALQATRRSSRNRPAVNYVAESSDFEDSDFSIDDAEDSDDDMLDDMKESVPSKKKASRPSKRSGVDGPSAPPSKRMRVATKGESVKKSAASKKATLKPPVVSKKPINRTSPTASSSSFDLPSSLREKSSASGKLGKRSVKKLALKDPWRPGHAVTSRNGRWAFTPRELRNDPYAFSSAQLDEADKCQKCAFKRLRERLARPKGFPLTLNMAFKALLTKEIDRFREVGKVHPLMEKHHITHLIPYKHSDDVEWKSWRNNFTGINTVHDASSMKIFSGVDDVWENPETKELHIIMYKATSKNTDSLGIDKGWQITYKRKIEMTQWILRQKGYKVSNQAYFIYGNVRKNEKGFCYSDESTGKTRGYMDFDMHLFPYEGNDSWVNDKIIATEQMLHSNIPPAASEDCDHCNYVEKIKESEINQVRPLKHALKVVSRSAVESYIKCKACFFSDRVQKIRTPPGFPFTLASSTDYLWKEEFDQFRLARQPHPLMVENNIDAIPFDPDPNDPSVLDKWREYSPHDPSSGARVTHHGTGLELFGYVDDIWVDRKTGELIVVDYKSTSKDDSKISLGEDWQKSYKRQLEMYQWIFRQMGYKVSDTAYVIYCNGDKTRPEFCFDDENGDIKGRMEFNLHVLPYVGKTDWIEPTLTEIKALVDSGEKPAPTENCGWCKYVEEAKEYDAEVVAKYASGDMS
ncbi:MAG: hypothetical protein ACI9S8_000407 [Chlamydiales bacterium]|jgi:hypothetical protein